MHIHLLAASLLISISPETQAASNGPACIRPIKVIEPASDTGLIRSCCTRIRADRRRVYFVSTRLSRMGIQLKGVYTRENLLFFRLKLANYSNIGYEVDSIRFIIADLVQNKEKNTWHGTITQVYAFGETKLVGGKSEEENVIVTSRFTLPAGKMLVIELSEKNGGRRLQLRVYNFTLLGARQI